MKIRSRTSSLFFFLALVAGPMACSAQDPDGTPPPATTTMALDYHQDAKVLLDRYCTDCHKQGGIAPFSLTDYGAAQSQAAQIKAAVMSGKMPPWMPSDKGQVIAHARTMRPEDSAALIAWVDQGAVEGDPQAQPRLVLPPADKVAPPRPDLIVDMGVTYNPNIQLADDYRCFVVDPLLTADHYIRATDVKPGNASIVHHVILYEIMAADAAKIRAKDTADAGPGYTCFGGAGTNNISMITGWAPGGVPNRLADDEGMPIHKGSLIVMQVHYNNRQNNGVGDRTVATLEFLPSPPAYEIELVPVANPDKLMIKAGDPNASQTISVPIAFLMGILKIPGTELVLAGNTPHMHTLGTRVATSIADGPMLLEIPHWDFHWQQGYEFQTPITLRGTDTLVVQCNYDNSYENQPIVDGQKQMPRDVTWGEGTADEMCLSFLHIRLPLTM